MIYLIDLLYYFFNFLYKHINKNKDFNKEIFGQFIKHLSVGGFGIILNYTSFNIFMKLDFGILKSNSLTNILVVLVIFFLQKYYTYKVHSEIVKHLFFFIFNSIGYYLIDTGLLFFLIQFLGLDPMVGKFISLIIITPISFLSQKFLVFK